MQFAPDAVFAALPDEVRPWLERFVARAARRGIDLYLVGGPVRDLALGRGIRDVDLLVEASQTKLLETLLRKLAGDELKVVRHERFGTWVITAPSFQLDIATTRRESYADAGALPSVEPAGLLEDLERRDFRVNALALPLRPPKDAQASRPPAAASAQADVASKPSGARRKRKGDRLEVIGPPRGLDDLGAASLDVIHARSFHDDPTRALRAARLGPRLGFDLSRASKVALRNALRDGAFGRVSGDRFRREFENLFSDAVLGLDPAQALKRLDSWHVLAALEPGLGLPRQVVAPLRRLGRALLDPPWRIAKHRPWVVGLTLWLAPLAPAMRRRALARLSVRGETQQRIIAFPKLRDAALKKLEAGRGRGGVDELLGDFDEETLLALFASASPSVRRRIVRWASLDRDRRTPIGGAEVVELGLEGPAVGRALARVRKAWLDSTITTREEALALAQELAHRALRRKTSEPKRARTPRKKARARKAPGSRSPDAQAGTEKAPAQKPRTARARRKKPSADTPRTDTPRTDTPGTDAPGTENSRTDAPGTEKSRTEKSRTEKSRTEKPRTEKSRTEKPRTGRRRSGKSRAKKSRAEKAQVDKSGAEKLPDE